MTLDNGQHILLGAYSKTLQMMAQVGIDTDAAFLRLPLQMHYPPLSGAMNFETPRLPAPLHLAVGLFKTKGLAWEDKIALARFFTACRHIRWDIGTDRPLVRLLEQFWQTPRLYGLLSVSYTHLDVYKRQCMNPSLCRVDAVECSRSASQPSSWEARILAVISRSA